MKKLQLLIAMVMVVSVAGCLPQSTNWVRVSKLDMSGQWIPFVEARTGGCVGEVQGDPGRLTLAYKDGECKATFTGDTANPGDSMKAETKTE